MPTNFPTNPDTYTTKVDGVDTVMAAHINDLQDAMMAVQDFALDLRDDLGKWQSYTPTWTASTTNPTLGNGILNGRYTQVGKLVTCNLYLQMGSTTTYGSGAWSFSLPKTAASVSTPGIGNWTGLDANGLIYCGQVLVAYGVSAINAFIRDGISHGFYPSVPFTWASGDVLQISAAYEIA